MAELVIPVGYGNATLHFTQDNSSKSMSTTFGYKLEDAIGNATVHASEIAGYFTQVGGFLAESIVLESWNFVGVTTIEPVEAGEPFLGEYSPTISGTGGSNPPPNNCAELVTKVTNRGGPTNRGRAYFPALHFTESSINANGIIDDTPLESIQSALTATFIDWADSHTPPVLLHTNPAQTPTILQGLVIQGQIATQRRRMR